jgi:hypothetical protein
MISQNPPLSHVAKASEIENYLRPESIATIYGILGISHLILVSLVFAVLVNESILSPTPLAITVFAIIALVPSTLASLSCLLRPNEPLSRYLTSKAALWRRPLTVQLDRCDFKVRLGSHDSAHITISFHYPAKDHTHPVKERLYTCVHAALDRDLATRNEVPASENLMALLDQTLENIAAEFEIPVLYIEIDEVTTVSETYHLEEATALAEPLSWAS